jgi:DNA polymerase
MPAMGADQNIDLRLVAVSALDWWRQAGVDVLVDEMPRDWLAAEIASASAQATKHAAPAVAAPVAVTLPETIEGFTAWRTSNEAPEAAWGGPMLAASGDPASDLVVMIDMPDRDDAMAGQLLSGAPGVLFDRMLAAIGRTRDSIYLTAFAVARPVSGRIPPADDAELARIARHLLALTAGKRLLMIGNATSRALIGAEIASARGSLQIVNHNRGTIEAVASFHPRFLIERPVAKAEAWKDLQMLIKGLGA